MSKRIFPVALLALFLVLVVGFPGPVKSTALAAVGLNHGVLPELPDALVSGNVWVPRPLRVVDGNPMFMYGLSDPNRATVHLSESLAFGDFVGAYYRNYSYSWEEMRALYLESRYFLRNGSGSEIELSASAFPGEVAILNLRYPANYVPSPGLYRIVVRNTGKERSWPIVVVK